MFENTGSMAGAIWTALNENGTLGAKELKKATKEAQKQVKEAKLSVAGYEKEPTFSLK